MKRAPFEADSKSEPNSDINQAISGLRDPRRRRAGAPPTQRVVNRSHLAEVNLHHGILKLRMLRLGLIKGTKAGSVSITVDGKLFGAKLSFEDGNYVVGFEKPVRVNEGQRLLVSLT